MRVWVNGSLCDEDEARVSPFDHGLLVGNGVFETIKAYDGTPFAVRRHVERLHHSAGPLGLEPPDEATLRAAMHDVLAANGLRDARVRITVTGGKSPLGSIRGGDSCMTVVAAGELGSWEPSTAVSLVPWPRNERSPLVGLKTTSYGENVVALAYARERGATEAVFANLQGRLCEGSGSNVFVGIGGRLLTPPLSSGCLAGVTRALLLEVTDAVEEDLPADALASASEAFLASTTREVQPISKVDDVKLPTAPGPLTRAAAAAFQDLVGRDLDP